MEKQLFGGLIDQDNEKIIAKTIEAHSALELAGKLHEEICHLSTSDWLLADGENDKFMQDILSAEEKLEKVLGRIAYREICERVRQ